MFCNGLGVQERDRARFSESSATVIMKIYKQFAIYLIPICILVALNGYLVCLMNQIQRTCVIKLHFDNSPNIPTEILDFLLENYTNIIVYREDWVEQVTCPNLSYYNNWHNRPKYPMIDEQFHKLTRKLDWWPKD